MSIFLGTGDLEAILLVLLIGAFCSDPSKAGILHSEACLPFILSVLDSWTRRKALTKNEMVEGPDLGLFSYIIVSLKVLLC